MVTQVGLLVESGKVGQFGGALQVVVGKSGALKWRAEWLKRLGCHGVLGKPPWGLVGACSWGPENLRVEVDVVIQDVLRWDVNILHR